MKITILDYNVQAKNKRSVFHRKYFSVLYLWMILLSPRVIGMFYSTMLFQNVNSQLSWRHQIADVTSLYSIVLSWLLWTLCGHNHALLAHAIYVYHVIRCFDWKSECFHGRQWVCLFREVIVNVAFYRYWL